jgi:integrase/recombinase XerC
MPTGLRICGRRRQAVFEAMLRGSAAAADEPPAVIEQRESHVRWFGKFTNDWPCSWTPTDVEDWTARCGRAGRGRIRPCGGYQNAVGLFCDYLTDTRYGWAEQCERRFGTHPVQILHEWNRPACR